MQENKAPKNREFDTNEVDSEVADGEMSEREIDENLNESFPASDPPSWTLGTEHHKAKLDKGQDE